ncbi:wax ester/triacylglycerol synthase domain-containing protein [Microbacterium trichothecenolyticum]|uniref:Putative diacylglycerol O-acyltransferase n=1 Tax=Microbacterium trichothecenolyticum TaxID=69370 RepID=A0A0M2H289_MICTR|nr:wax ester/triacylglycerol synthase domain-containing protein [Microbacterium trichothecenolyticum]KJL40344.1 putative diacylglycerol O-acyltransferase [Microbacterium trichothecenolyticum]
MTTASPVVSDGTTIAPVPGVRIDMVRTLDEQNIGSSIAYEAMHTGAVLTIEGAGYLRPDGTLDRERIHAQLRHSLARVPEFGMKLLRSPLGLTTPAWVPDPDFDPREHVEFFDTPTALDSTTVRTLAGFDKPVLAQDRPLWDMRFTVLTTGEIALGARMHHVVGDGQWGFSVIQRVTGDEPLAPDPEFVLEPTGVPPRSAWAVPLQALRDYRARSASAGGLWREYWRKPVLKRAKRVASRDAWFVKEYVIRRRGLRAAMLPATRPVIFEVAASPAARQAAKLRGSLNDLVVAAAMGAVDDDDRGIDVLVPVSRRRKGVGGDVRNHVSMARAHSEPGATLAERVAAVRQLVRTVARGEDEPPSDGRLAGYATLMPLAESYRWFGDARVNHVAILPAGDPRSEISVFATVYVDDLAVTVVSREELDVEGIADRVEGVLAGAGPVRVAAAPAVEPASSAADGQEAAA